MPTKKQKLTIMISSTVYGIEELLDRIYTLLTAFGYEVWMSHKGTMPVFSNRSAFENCIKAVEKCDLFLCLITTQYGSGREEDGISISHQELNKAIELRKPRWLLAHDHVVLSRKLLNDLGFVGQEGRAGLKLKKKASSLSDLRLIDMYEEAILSQHPLRDRQGNWVQKFQADEDALLFATAQFSRYQEVEAFIRENFSDPSTVSDSITRKGEPA
ncbi:MAG: DUF4062 domain-containing protein [Thermodesulfobacteriota bacterium]